LQKTAYVMAKQPTIAITGANGFIGSGLVSYFSQKGWQVVCLVRRPPAESTKGILYRSYDVSRSPSKSLLDGVDYLVHAAYVKEGSADIDAYTANVTGAKRLLSLSHASGVKKSIFLSSLSAKETAISVYGQQKYAIEKTFNTSSDAVLRPGLVIGNGGLVAEMVKFIQSKHAVPVIDGGKQPLQIVDVPSIAQAIERITTKNLHGTYIVASQESYTYKSFYLQIAKTLKTKIILVPIPHTVLYGLLRLANKVGFTGVGTDSLLGLKTMSHIESKDDLHTLGVTIPPMAKLLAKSLTSSESKS
jgi:nucleoside-diphosphate-sugar epimerase